MEKEQSLTEYYTKLDGWYKDNEAALRAARDTASRGHGNGNGNSDPDPNRPAPAAPLQSPSMTPEEIRRIANEAVNEAGRDYIAVSAFLTTQGAWHSHVFGEPLDMTELVNNPKLGRPILGQPGRVFSLQDAYQEKYGERIATKNREAEDSRINAEVEKRLADRTREAPGNRSCPSPAADGSRPKTDLRPTRRLGGRRHERLWPPNRPSAHQARFRERAQPQRQSGNPAR